MKSDAFTIMACPGKGARRGARAAAAMLGGLLLLAGCAQEAPPPQTTSAAASASAVTELQKTDLVKGVGEGISQDQTAVVHYTGWVYDPTAPDQKGKRFDSSRDRGQPFRFVVGAGRVIKGWDEGVQGMQAGGQRRLIIPASLGYGDSGAGGVIPPGATLLFEIELLAIE